MKSRRNKKITSEAIVTSLYINRKKIGVAIAWTCSLLCLATIFNKSEPITANAWESLAAIGSAPSTFISEESANDADTTVYQLPYNAEYTGKKCYESYSSITDTTTLQYELQQSATTDEDAFRKIDNRYLVSIGTHFNAPCGTYIDIVLENGTVIPCIVGDIKPDECTDITNTYTKNNSATEFIVDATKTTANISGDVSSLYDEWQSKVKEIVVYQS